MSSLISIPIDFTAIFRQFIIFVINFHEYANDFVFISAQKVRKICHSTTLILNLTLLGNYQQRYE